MDLVDLLTERVGAFLGQHSATTHAIPTSAECEAVTNFITRRARLRKIWGATLYKDIAFGTGEIKWLDYFRNRWIFQRGNSIGVESSEGSAEFSELGEIIGGTSRRVFSDKWTDVVFLSNGFENKYIDFETFATDKFLNVGLTPPGGGILQGSAHPQASFSVQAPSAGNPTDLPTGTHYYAMTFWDDERQVESMPYGSFVGEDGLYIFPETIAEVAFTSGVGVSVGSANLEVAINVAAILALGYDTDRVTHYIIYRKDSVGVYKRVPLGVAGAAIVPIATTVSFDQEAEADLGQVLDLSISPPPSGKYYRDAVGNPNVSDYGPRFVKFHRDQLWHFGVNYPGTENGYDTETGQPLRFYPLSGVAYASEVGTFDYTKYSYRIGVETGQRDTGMGKHRNTLMFFKESSAYYLDGTSPENYEIRTMDDKRGITVSGSLQETTAGIIGLGADGFLLFDATSGGKIISEKIHDMVEKINLTYSDKITSSFDPEEEKYECHCPIENTYNTLVFILDIKTMSWTFLRRAGGAAAYGLSSSRRTVGLLGGSQNGKLYLTTDRSAVTFNGQTMHASWRSKHFDFGKPGDLKGLQAVVITARAKRDFRVSIDIIPDFAQSNAVSVEDVDPDVREDVLASDADDAEGMLWDEGQFGNGMVKKKFTILIQAVAETFQLIVRSSDTDADRARFEIEEIMLYASLMDGGDDS